MESEADMRLPEKRLNAAYDLVHEALSHGNKKFGPMRSRHEACAIILEEYLEVQHCVFHDHGSIALKSELADLGAMCIRAMVDLKL